MTLMLVRYSESRDFAVQIHTRDGSVTNQRTHIVATLPLLIERHLGPVREAAEEGRACSSTRRGGLRRGALLRRERSQARRQPSKFPLGPVGSSHQPNV